jgi:hypothetical protein
MYIDEEFRELLMATFREEAAQNLDELAGFLEAFRSGTT